MKKNLFGTASALLTSILLLVSCGGSKEPVLNEQPAPTEKSTDGTETTTQSEGITISFSWWGSDSRHEALQEVAKLYEEKTGVKVVVDYGAWSGWDQKILTMLSGGEETDIMQLNYNWLHSFGRGQNVFYDLNELSDYITLDNWNETYLEAMTVNGELSAVPHGFASRMFIMNIPLFEEYGLDYPSTYKEMVDYGKIIGADNTATGADNKYLLTSIGPQSTDLFIGQMLYDKTGRVMQTDGTINYTVDEVKEIFDLYKELEDSGAMPNFLQEDAIQNESNPVWTSGRSGSVYEWVGALDKYLSSYKGGEAINEIKIAPYVTFNEGNKATVYGKPSLSYGISRNSEHPEEAAKFIEFLFTDKEAVELTGSQLGVSVNNITREYQDELGLITGAMAEGYKMLEDYEQVVLDPYYEDANVRGKRYEVIEKFRTGELNSEDAAVQYIELQQAELDRLFN